MSLFQWSVLGFLMFVTAPAFGLGYLLGREDGEENRRRRWPRG